MQRETSKQKKGVKKAEPNSEEARSEWTGNGIISS